MKKIKPEYFSDQNTFGDASEVDWCSSFHTTESSGDPFSSIVRTKNKKAIFDNYDPFASFVTDCESLLSNNTGSDSKTVNKVTTCSISKKKKKKQQSRRSENDIEESRSLSKKSGSTRSDRCRTADATIDSPLRQSTPKTPSTNRGRALVNETASPETPIYNDPSIRQGEKKTLRHLSDEPQTPSKHSATRHLSDKQKTPSKHSRMWHLSDEAKTPSKHSAMRNLSDESKTLSKHSALRRLSDEPKIPSKTRRKTMHSRIEFCSDEEHTPVKPYRNDTETKAPKVHSYREMRSIDEPLIPTETVNHRKKPLCRENSKSLHSVDTETKTPSRSRRQLSNHERMTSLMSPVNSPNIFKTPPRRSVGITGNKNDSPDAEKDQTRRPRLKKMAKSRSLSSDDVYGDRPSALRQNLNSGDPYRGYSQPRSASRRSLRGHALVSRRCLNSDNVNLGDCQPSAGDPQTSASRRSLSSDDSCKGSLHISLRQKKLAESKGNKIVGEKDGSDSLSKNACDDEVNNKDATTQSNKKVITLSRRNLTKNLHIEEDAIRPDISRRSLKEKLASQRTFSLSDPHNNSSCHHSASRGLDTDIRNSSQEEKDGTANKIQSHVSRSPGLRHQEPSRKQLHRSYSSDDIDDMILKNYLLCSTRKYNTNCCDKNQTNGKASSSSSSRLSSSGTSTRQSTPNRPRRNNCVSSLQHGSLLQAMSKLDTYNGIYKTEDAELDIDEVTDSKTMEPWQKRRVFAAYNNPNSGVSRSLSQIVPPSA